MTREQVFAELKSRGASKAVAAFYGGTDQGGVDAIALLDQNGDVIEALDEHWPQPGMPPFTDAAIAEDRLARAIAEPAPWRDGLVVAGYIVWGVSAQTVATETLARWPEHER